MQKGLPVMRGMESMLTPFVSSVVLQDPLPVQVEGSVWAAENASTTFRDRLNIINVLNKYKKPTNAVIYAYKVNILAYQCVSLYYMAGIK